MRSPHLSPFPSSSVLQGHLKIQSLSAAYFKGSIIFGPKFLQKANKLFFLHRTHRQIQEAIVYSRWANEELDFIVYRVLQCCK